MVVSTFKGVKCSFFFVSYILLSPSSMETINDIVLWSRVCLSKKGKKATLWSKVTETFCFFDWKVKEMLSVWTNLLVVLFCFFVFVFVFVFVLFLFLFLFFLACHYAFVHEFSFLKITWWLICAKGHLKWVLIH